MKDAPSLSSGNCSALSLNLIKCSINFNCNIFITMTTKPSKDLETFENPKSGRDYTINIDIPEFTCLCPKTGQPDFATIRIEYVPNELCIELKALKLYMWAFRDEGAFHEAVTNEILDDLVKAIDPTFIRVQAEFNVRGGLYTTVTVEHTR